LGTLRYVKAASIALSFALTLRPALTAIPATASPTPEIPNAPTAVAVTLQHIYQRAYDEAYSRHATTEPDGTTFVSTGDINAEWLRDSSAVLMPYIGLASTDSYVRNMLRGAIARQAKYILIDPYANAFTSDYQVAERKFEMDSLLYPIRLAYVYWKATGDRSIFTPTLQRALTTAVRTLRLEQHHATRSHYRHTELANNGVGTRVAYTGLVWTAFRPSDDAARYQYNIPDNMFAAVVLQQLTEIERSVYHDNAMAEETWGLAVQIRHGIEHNALVNVPGLGRVYAYEIDGFGNANLMDDANVPSLLSAPYFGYVNARDSVYKATRTFVLSQRNPYYFAGKYASGIGSPHTPHGYIWPMSLVMEAITSTDPIEVSKVMGYIAASDTGDHRLHESFNSDWPESYTRDDFAWPNALFAQLMLARQGRLPAVLESLAR